MRRVLGAVTILGAVACTGGPGAIPNSSDTQDSVTVSNQTQRTSQECSNLSNEGVARTNEGAGSSTDPSVEQGGSRPGRCGQTVGGAATPPSQDEIAVGSTGSTGNGASCSGSYSCTLVGVAGDPTSVVLTPAADGGCNCITGCEGLGPNIKLNTNSSVTSNGNVVGSWSLSGSTLNASSTSGATTCQKK